MKRTKPPTHSSKSWCDRAAQLLLCLAGRCEIIAQSESKLPRLPSGIPLARFVRLLFDDERKARPNRKHASGRAPKAKAACGDCVALPPDTRGLLHTVSPSCAQGEKRAAYS